MRPTPVFETYWRFAAERQAVYLRRLEGLDGPWTDDPVIRAHRFTNAYRASDRVSQFLIAEVQHAEHRSQAPAEVFFRTILFKIFNRIDTWLLIERKLGSISWQATPLSAIAEVLDGAFGAGRPIYSAAYIMPSPQLGLTRKHANHLSLIGRMMEDGMPGRVASARSLDKVFALLLAYPGLGRFLAFQYAIDLNYSSLLDFDEQDFVIAGPGAIDGIAKCFADVGDRSPEEVIYWTAENQDRQFARLGIAFPGLFGRPLMPIDCQNLFCEISKYARVAHPEVKGVSGRTRIKQVYRTDGQPLAAPRFPARWRLDVPRHLAPAPNLLSNI
jgi:hypothetical protein